MSFVDIRFFLFFDYFSFSISFSFIEIYLLFCTVFFYVENTFDDSNVNDARGGLNDVSLHHQHQQIPSEYKQTAMSANEHRDKYYATVRKPMNEQHSPMGNTLERIPEYSEDIYPYATFHLPDEDNMASNPMLMSRYSGSSNAGTIPISANLYNSRNSMSSMKEVS